MQTRQQGILPGITVPEPLPGCVDFPTTPEQRVLLRNAGFVHVTGLQMWIERGHPDSDKWKGRVGFMGHSCESQEREQRGCHTFDMRRVALKTEGGEVWVASAPTLWSQRDKTIRFVLQHLCKKGALEHPQYLVDETLDFLEEDLMDRLADPDISWKDINKRRP